VANEQEERTQFGPSTSLGEMPRCSDRDASAYPRLPVSDECSDRADQSDLAIVGNSVSGLRETASGVAAQGIFIDNQGGGSAQGRVAGNTVSDIQSNFGAIGILIQVSDVSVTNNRIRGLHGLFAQGLNYTVTGGVNGRAELNTLEDISGSKFPGEGVKIDSGGVSSLELTQNNLLPPVGINSVVSEELNAECNYWGSPSGPEPVGNGSEVIGNVDFRPWSIGRIGNGRGSTCRGGQ